MAIDLSGFNACWTFSSAGITNESGPWNAVNPLPSPHNCAFIQASGSMEQAFTAGTAGTYTIAYQAQIRPDGAQQKIQVKVDGTVIDTPGNAFNAFNWTARSFICTVPAGAHVLRFEGLSTIDQSILIDSVTIADPSSNPVSLPNGNFDSYIVPPGQFVTNPPAVASAVYRLVATVTTSGKWLFCRLTKISDGTDVAFVTFNEDPIVSVNGVSRGAIRTSQAVQTTAHTGCLIPMPSGVTVTAGQAVTLSASAGWVFGPNGYAEAMATQAATNRVGQSFAPRPVVPNTMLIGTGAGAQLTPEWNPATMLKNWRYRCSYSSPGLSAADAGGKPTVMSGSPTIFPICNVGSGTTNYIDSTGFPGIAGYWAVRWDDLDGGSDLSTGTNFGLSVNGDPNTSIAEMTSLNNVGVGGVGKVRVFNLAGVGGAVNLKLWLQLIKADLHPHFDNLAILAPGDFTWTAATPTVIPMPAWSDVSAIQQARMPDALPLGPFRFNDAAVGVGGIEGACEKEHMIQPGDFHWAGDVKVQNSFGYTQAQPWNPTNSPYIYSTILGSYGSTFPMTLFSPIVANPAGSQEVVTITPIGDGIILPGLVLFLPSGEHCRVMSGSSQNWTIERGSESTTPAAQARATVQVNGRYAIPSLAAWGGTNWQIVELVTNVPHTLRSGQVVTFQGSGWPAWTFSDGRGGEGGTYTNWNRAAFVTGANTVVFLSTNVAPSGSPNSTLGRVWNAADGITPANCYTSDGYPSAGGGGGGCPSELAVAMTARHPGAPCWVPITCAASNDMVDEYARRALANSTPGREVWIEHSNEPWNNAYRNRGFTRVLDNILFGGSSSGEKFVAIRTEAMKQRFINIFNAAGRGSEVKSLINMQTTQWGSLAEILAVMIPDGIAVAPYFIPYPHPSIYKAYAAFPTDMSVDVHMWDHWYGNSSGSFNWGGHNQTLMGQWQSTIAAANAAHGSNIRLNIYEYAPYIPAALFDGNLGAAMDAVTTTLTLSAGEDPQPLNISQYDAAMVQPGSWLMVNSEWMHVTARTGAVCTVTRGQSGTAAAAHPNGARCRGDWIEFVRDVTLHPNFRVFTGDAFALFQSKGVHMCVCSTQSGVWYGGQSLDDYHGFPQLPGAGDGSDGRANNLICPARPGPDQKPPWVNQDLNTVSVRGRAQIDWASPPVIPPSIGDWPYHRDIGTLVNTVSWIDFTAANFDFTKTKPDGSDLRVYDVTAAAFLPVWMMDYGAASQSGRIYFLASDVSHQHRLYYGNPAAPAVSTFLKANSGVFDGGSGFDGDFGDLTTAIGNAGSAAVVPESAGPSDPRNFRVWSIAELPTLQYSDTGLGGNYQGVREFSLVRDAITGLPKQIGGQYYVTFARRVPPSAGQADKLDSVIAHGPTINGPWTGYTVFYDAPGTIRLCCPATVLWVASANKYVCYLTYGWDTGGAGTPGLTTYVLTSPDLITWLTPAVKALDSSIWTDAASGNPCTDNGNPWVIRCADGVYFLVVEAENAPSLKSWCCVGATATDPINGPWTACNGGLALVADGGAGSWDSSAVANPKVMQLPDGTYVLQYNGFSDNSIGNCQHGFATSPTRDGPWTKATFNPTTGRLKDSYGFETSSLHYDTDGKTLVNFGQRFGDWNSNPAINTGSGTAKIFKLGSLLKRGGLLVTPDPTDASAMGKVIASGTFTAESRSSFTAHRATGATPSLLGLMDYAAMPAAGASGSFETQRMVDIFRWSHDFVPSASAGPGDVTFVYWDLSGNRHYWNGTIWMATGTSTGRNLPADHGREVVARISDDGTSYILTAVYADDGTTIGSTTVPKSSVRGYSSGRLLFAGDIATDSWGSGLYFRYLHVRPYAATGVPPSLGAPSGGGNMVIRHQRNMTAGFVSMG
jgi:hypothetical protein